MGNVRRFSAINTKLRVMRSRLLQDSDYKALILSSSVSDQIYYLSKNTEYGTVITDIVDINNLQKVEVELERFLIKQFEKILIYFQDDYSEFFKALMFRYETEDLKLYLRALARGESLTKFENASFIKHRYYSFSYDKIKTAKNLEEFINKLKGTKFYDVLYPYRHEDYKKLVFYMEMNLDRMYFKSLSDASEILDDEDKRIFDDLKGVNIDLLNLEWIYRGIKFYDLLPEELINYTLPGGKLIDFKLIKELCYGDVEHFIEKVSKTPYKSLVNTEKDIDLFMEIRLQRFLYNKLKGAFKKSKLNIEIPLAYLHLLEFEIRDIISILEAKKYDLSYSETKDYLIRDLEGSDN